ncbi:MAG TPA: helix-hairpin-helix domain-containing protein [Longimicrobium sp.]|nr:helix-hairpin-helix domain-containing protein [Longimicrobium sp.]
MRSDRRGFALLAVLWALVLTASLAAELHVGVRGDQRIAANARAEARLRWAARGGLAGALETLRARLATAAATGALVTTDTLIVPAHEMELDRVKVRATVVDARSKLQLNTATPDELAALFAALGYGDGDARALSAAVARWRAEHLPPYEALATDSSETRLRPPRGAFAAVEELRTVPGVSAAAYASAAPYLTVDSDGRINLNTASATVLQTLPGIGAAGAAAVVERRRRSPFLSPYEVVDVLPRDAREAAQAEIARLIARTAFVPREAEVRVTARVPGSPLVARVRAVAVMPGGPRLPVVSVVER